MGLDLLQVLGYPLSAETKESVVWERVRKHLAMAGTIVLFFDEFQNCSSRANVDEAVRIRDTIRSLLVDDRPIILVIAGLPEIVDFVCVDDQVRRRSRFTSLETLDVDDAGILTDAVTKLAALADLSLEADFENDVVPRLLHAAAGQLGLAIEMSIEAIMCALRPISTDADDEEVHLPRRGRLLLEDFARMFEDRTDNMSFANPFHSGNAHWHEIDPTLVNVHLPSQMVRKGGRGTKDPRKGGGGAKGAGK